jgi:predicted enzyme related to lactoylglutathione lyase
LRRITRRKPIAMIVVETFFSIEVEDMNRATSFYVEAFGATVPYASPGWSSLLIAGVRVGLALSADRESDRVGLHFAVDDLDEARHGVERAGGSARPQLKGASGVTLVEATDTEGNTFILTQGQAKHRK